MIKLILASIVITTIAGVFAFTNVTAAVPGIALIIFWTFLVLSVVAAVGWLWHRRKASSHKPPTLGPAKSRPSLAKDVN